MFLCFIINVLTPISFKYFFIKYTINCRKKLNKKITAILNHKNLFLIITSALEYVKHR